ncbi:polysaccharide deacetylase family protein [Paenibacillus lautus]|jgi:polysaccharide deacetylase family sporulation protein PdaB|uniref:polysaccharide deacetylase family protein n=1 Tax=Paenibacillus lautus TaxID=1401 RepID=UPI0026EC6156|nr:polysaccharide deacetylase family protein [Paenibacillus lautus]MCI1772830.1 polysaccharide deacetylase family protein [Paenibacillus lautus]
MKKRTRSAISLLAFALFLGYPGHAKADHVPSASKGRDYYEERGEIVWEVPTQNKVIALTFDDGPDERNTVQILDLLKQYDAKATFFVVGSRVEKHPDIVARELQEGHEIGNHSYTHPPFHNINVSKLSNELNQTQDAIYQATGLKTVLFRPPGGSYNEAIVRTSKDLGMLTVLWSWHQDTLDWRKPGVSRIVQKVLDNAHNGDIVLMHDFVPSSTQTVEALKVILPELQKRGYSFVTVSELISHHEKSRKIMEVTH